MIILTAGIARPRKFLFGASLVLVFCYLLLLIPEHAPPRDSGAKHTPFAWNQDVLWASLEAQFKAARQTGCAALSGTIDSLLAQLQRQLDELQSGSYPPADNRFDVLETNLFQLAPRIAACPDKLATYIEIYSRLRETIKMQSKQWDMTLPATRQRLYRLLYGGRAALEEVMLQSGPGTYPALLSGRDEPSATPGSKLQGVTLHSGDILVSRGGAPNSALIARGNDFPGNFSHIALLHLDPATGAAVVIEAHIERGVAVAAFEDYLKEKKLRIMALRLRADSPGLAKDPQLPHRAAAGSLAEARTRHIPYDFTMDYEEHSRVFCSEVASAAYEKMGVKLWMGRSQLSGPGVRAWLGLFGARHFETQEPADLEYDPQLCVVAEWRDPNALWQDHLDNAVTDALLERADAGETLEYSRMQLPLARVAKAWSVLLNGLGRVGPIPEGMSATAALRNKAFTRRHAAIKARLVALADQFRTAQGYPAPYWELVKLARQAVISGP